DRVTGRMDWLPGAKDRMTGTLDGTRRGDLLYVLYNYKAEGTNTLDQRVFRLGANELVQLDGPTVQLESGWELKDPAQAVEGMRVPEVPCP
ncbi:MAG TPA: hypothetical protein VHL57_09795, partial [Flavobacteriales bacterium]|nr:hypothetical protein [Flavobacteriales bacterium]